MGLAFGAISASLSAGLVLYIAFGSILNVVQTQIFKWLRLA
jgi:membrane protein insertase Oxa1/YidC/SpoIIIJ